MIIRTYSGLFVPEGTSDEPLAAHIERLFFDKGCPLALSKPDFARLPKVGKDVASRVRAGLKLVDGPVDVIVVHRDADNAGQDARRQEIESAVRSLRTAADLVPVIPIRMTEAWLLLDEAAIRHVAGKPGGRARLKLPKAHEVESRANPKGILRDCLLAASEASGRRRAAMDRRFDENRKQLLERLDLNGPVLRLESWCSLIADIEGVVKRWRSGVAR
ncbi:hypothetical protein GCM10011608_53720 [Micromonospora sonchi]|uniref:DUF4276 family protein n=1 Tax=Micromonospora sonchi TaxID=1763543 RepID=A0A917X455_9ACTN|nr:DUF4276 family protein [Micromonospora sonchi]GGM61839.1 hypothetical protein GCM10011608_53720 [Micromonospora sonchi]